MKKHIYLTQSDLLDKTHSVLFDGICEVEKGDGMLAFTYVEEDGVTKVEIKANDQEFHILRKGEMTSTIALRKDAYTKGNVTSVYGVIPFTFYMDKYHYLDEMIALTYQILNEGEVNGSKRLVCKIKEV